MSLFLLLSINVIDFFHLLSLIQFGDLFEREMTTVSVFSWESITVTHLCAIQTLI